MRDSSAARLAASLLAAARTLADSPWVQGLLVALLFRHAWPLMMTAARLPAAAYESASPLAAVLRGLLGGEPGAAAVALLPPLVLLPFWRRLRWSRIDPGRRTRGLVLVPATVMTWTFATLPHNFYFDQAYLLDRLLLVVLLAAIWLHPLFVHLATFALLVIGSQVTHPLVGAEWSWVDKRLPLDLLILFGCFLLVRTITPARSWLFALSALTLTGGTYWNAAVSKLELGGSPLSWLFENHISNLVVSSHLGIGWLGWLDTETVLTLARSLSPFDPLSAAATLLLELGGVLVLVSRRATRGVLLGFVVLHTAIVLTSGIFFWKWIVVDLALAWYVGRLDRDGSLVDAAPAAAGGPLAGTKLERWLLPRRLYEPATLALAILLVIGIRGWSWQVPFAWFDSRYVNTFEIYGVDPGGDRHRLGGRFFAPYDVLFHQSRFFYLTAEPLLVDTFGTTLDLALLRRLEAVTVEDLPELRRELGNAWDSPSHGRSLARFLGRWVANAGAGPDRGAIWRWIAPPFHFRSSRAADAWDGRAPLVAVEVILVEQLHLPDRVVTIHRVPVLAVPLASPQGATDEVALPAGEVPGRGREEAPGL